MTDVGDWLTIPVLLNPGSLPHCHQIVFSDVQPPQLASTTSAKAAEPLSTAAVPHPLQKE